MKIEIPNATIRIDNHEEGYYSAYFKSPFNCFISIDFKKAVVFYKIDKKEDCQVWEKNSDLFKKILWKISHESNKQSLTIADIKGYFIMRKDGAVAVIEELHLECSTEQLETENASERRHNQEIQQIRDLFATSKKN